VKITGVSALCPSSELNRVYNGGVIHSGLKNGGVWKESTHYFEGINKRLCIKIMRESTRK
jgi:hypothetical protein